MLFVGVRVLACFFWGGEFSYLVFRRYVFGLSFFRDFAILGLGFRVVASLFQGFRYFDFRFYGLRFSF